jgi:hypothetical protein
LLAVPWPNQFYLKQSLCTVAKQLQRNALLAKLEKRLRNTVNQAQKFQKSKAAELIKIENQSF